MDECLEERINKNGRWSMAIVLKTDIVSFCDHPSQVSRLE
jgi:hypothetical protein